ncbi:MAG: DUF4911 domain-containing protein [Candidatus Electrothrix sp. LOE2]|nr:DUF4911 domain-containing protein [Candidatus Electrothrix sp. LOE2]
MKEPGAAPRARCVIAPAEVLNDLNDLNDRMQTFYLRVRPERIALFRFLLEGYDGLAVLSTMDAKDGLVRLIVPQSRYTELWRLLFAICDDLR